MTVWNERQTRTVETTQQSRTRSCNSNNNRQSLHSQHSFDTTARCDTIARSCITVLSTSMQHCFWSPCVIVYIEHHHSVHPHHWIHALYNCCYCTAPARSNEVGCARLQAGATESIHPTRVRARPTALINCNYHNIHHHHACTHEHPSKCPRPTRFDVCSAAAQRRSDAHRCARHACSPYQHRPSIRRRSSTNCACYPFFVPFSAVS